MEVSLLCSVVAGMMRGMEEGRMGFRLVRWKAPWISQGKVERSTKGP